MEGDCIELAKIHRVSAVSVASVGCVGPRESCCWVLGVAFPPPVPGSVAHRRPRSPLRLRSSPGPRAGATVKVYIPCVCDLAGRLTGPTRKQSPTPHPDHGDDVHISVAAAQPTTSTEGSSGRLRQQRQHTIHPAGARNVTSTSPLASFDRSSRPPRSRVSRRDGPTGRCRE